MNDFQRKTSSLLINSIESIQVQSEEAVGHSVAALLAPFGTAFSMSAFYRRRAVLRSIVPLGQLGAINLFGYAVHLSDSPAGLFGRHAV